MFSLYNKYYVYLMLIFLLSISGCDPCESFKSEPVLSVYFNEPIAIDRVYALIIFDDNTIEVGGNFTEYGDNYYELPIDLNRTATTYVFESDNKSDTLEISYQTTQKLTAHKCGLVLTLYDVSLTEKTTFIKTELIAESNHIQVTIR